MALFTVDCALINRVLVILDPFSPFSDCKCLEFFVCKVSNKEEGVYERFNDVLFNLLS